MDKLWVESGGRLDSESDYIDEARRVHAEACTFLSVLRLFMCDHQPPSRETASGGAESQPETSEVSSSAGGSSSQSQQVLISVANPSSGDYLSVTRLEALLDLMEDLHTMTVVAGGEEFTLNDLCFKVRCVRLYNSLTALHD